MLLLSHNFSSSWKRNSRPFKIRTINALQNAIFRSKCKRCSVRAFGKVWIRTTEKEEALNMKLHFSRNNWKLKNIVWLFECEEASFFALADPEPNIDEPFAQMPNLWIHNNVVAREVFIEQLCAANSGFTNVCHVMWLQSWPVFVKSGTACPRWHERRNIFAFHSNILLYLLCSLLHSIHNILGFFQLWWAENDFAKDRKFWLKTRFWASIWTFKRRWIWTFSSHSFSEDA